MIITVCGLVRPDADRFEVNLWFGSHIALQFNPRYHCDGYVVLNTCSNGWGSEEHKYETPFPRGHPFAVQILVKHDSYKISTNGKPFTEYKHRLPFEQVDSISVEGKVELHLVHFHYLPTHHAATPGPFVVPYKSIIHGGLQPDKAIIIQGVTSPQANSMEILLRFMTGVAFSYSLRFNENVVVCNSYTDGKWNEEERSELKLFERGKHFLVDSIRVGEMEELHLVALPYLAVTISCSRHCYLVFVNGKEAYTYMHRYTELENVDILQVSGDVGLTFVQP